MKKHKPFLKSRICSSTYVSINPQLFTGIWHSVSFPLTQKLPFQRVNSKQIQQRKPFIFLPIEGFPVAWFAFTASVFVPEYRFTAWGLKFVQWAKCAPFQHHNPQRLLTLKFLDYMEQAEAIVHESVSSTFQGAWK